MAISRLSSSRLSTGLPKFQTMWDSDNVAQGVIEPIATVNITSTGGFSFSNIPQIYKDLMLVSSNRGTAAETNGYSIMYFNGDASGTSYSRVYFYGTGSTTAGAADTNYSQFYGLMAPGANAAAGVFSTSVVHLLNYSSTNQFKTILERNATDLGGSGFSMVSAGLWRSTAAITSINGGSVAGTYAPGSNFTLYGIRN